MRQFCSCLLLGSFLAFSTASTASDRIARHTAEFHLYFESNPRIDLSCDLFRNLKIETFVIDGGTEKLATLSTMLKGSCEVVDPQSNRRFYMILSEQIDECGTKTLQGIDRNRSEIKIVDYSNTTCEFVIPAIVVVTEAIDSDAPVTTLYGIRP